MSYPACFPSQAQYDHWARLARQSGTDPTWPCIDCTKAFQRRMYQAGRCEHPDAFPGDPRPCPVPSAAATPEASSGKTPITAQPKPKAANKGGRKRRRSAPSAAKRCSVRSEKPAKPGAAKAKPRRQT